MDKHKRISRQIRFLRDPQPIRLGNIASNVSRIGSHLDDARLASIVMTFIRESKFFCEWAGIEAAQDDIETAAVLAALQRQLVQWEHHFDVICADPARRAEMARVAREWSDRLLQMSGLLDVGWPRARELAKQQSNV